MYSITHKFHVLLSVVAVVFLQLDTISSAGRPKLSYLEIMNQFKCTGHKTRNVPAFPSSGLQSIRNAFRNCPKQINTDYGQYQPPEHCKKTSTIKCDKYAPYRTIDGSCNNLRYPEFGKSFNPQGRFLAPAYDDGMGSPRTRSVDGGTLPSARLVSNIVFAQKDNNDEDRRLSLMAMTWGQFTEHDIAATPAQSADANDNLITCCDKQPPLPEPCFPIPIPANDPFFKTKCMEFVRSTPVDNNNCPCEPREQINTLTSYIDASNVYGSTKEEVDKLRSFKDGLLLVSARDLLPPRADQTTCTLTDPGDFCFLAGEKRLHVVPTLASMHVTFVRYHNDLASKLQNINPHWNDERIFQETRKIIGAVMQKINFDEYLPAVLNYDIRRKYCLTPECQKYDGKVDAGTVNSFAVTAFRFGHSQIAGMNALLKLIKSKSKCPYSYGYTRKRCPMSEIIETERVPTESTFQNPKLVFDNVDGLQLFQVTNASLKADGEFDDSIRNKLFLDADNNSLDLGAIDIQRGRDHGIPGYTEFRKFCGLSPVKYFHSGKYGLSDHNHRNIKLLRKAYRHVRDIDVFVGGQTEEHLPHSVVGPTFSCLIAEQYKRYKIGDRFWWERPDVVVGFTPGQRRSISRIRFSKILCEMHNLSEIQPYVLFLPNQKWNRRRSCRFLPSLDLRAWREHRRW